jgi:beta-galactosidase
MKRIAGMLGCVLGALSLTAQVHQERLLTKGWKFEKTADTTACLPGYNDSKWQQVEVPHDWAISGPFSEYNDLQKVQIIQNNETDASIKSGRTGGLPYIGAGCYRTSFSISQAEAGGRVRIVFDGAMSDAVVYVNGRMAGRWPYGYNSFFFDITSLLRPGENLLAVRLQNQPESSRWYPGAGLYRNVHLLLTPRENIAVWGTYITTPVIRPGMARVEMATTVEADPSAFDHLSLVTTIQAPGGQVVATANTVLMATDSNRFHQVLEVQNPLLWSPESPVLYTAVSRLYNNGLLRDEYTTTFGIRSFKFEAGKGFSLNGQYRKFKGVCNHHDLGPLGTAINVDALRKQLTMLKDMGADAIRTSHNMPAPELVKLCDEMGFMMMVESFDEWKSPKVKNGYSHLFDEWAEKDIVNMIRHYRNNPSVIMWSIGNEIPDQSTKGGNKILKFLQDICHREDPTRPVTAGMDRIWDAVNNNFAALLDIPGFNYKPRLYDSANKRLPQGFILGTETASTVSSRGVYKFPVTPAKMKMYDDNQCSSYDVEYCNWSQIPDDEFVKQDDLPFVVGEFVWTGFDYLGEPTPYDEKWPSHSSYFGIIDLASIPKDRYYLYRSKWNTQSPTLHLVPHWTFPGREGQVTPVFCYTSYPAAELFVNGKSMGRQAKNTSSNMSRYRLMWNDVVYQPGNIHVVAYDSLGNKAAEQVVYTAGKPHHIEVTADTTMLKADGKSLAYLTVKVVDAKGNLCPLADNEVAIKVTGAGRFKGIANGDAANIQSFVAPHMKVFGGMLTTIVTSAETPGEVRIVAEAKGLRSAAVTLQSR